MAGGCTEGGGGVKGVKEGAKSKLSRFKATQLLQPQQKKG